MPRLHYRHQAIRDLLQIGQYITRRSGSSAVAAKFVQKLRDQCKKLARLPGVMGRERSDLGPGLRSFPFGNYIIIFEYRKNYFDVVSIVERHRDIGALFDEDQ